MVKVYAIALVLGVLAVMIVIFGSFSRSATDGEESGPGRRIGTRGKLGIGAVLGFGIGGMSAEFSPLDLGWAPSLAIAMAAGVVSTLWVRYSLRQTEA